MIKKETEKFGREDYYNIGMYYVYGIRTDLAAEYVGDAVSNAECSLFHLNLIFPKEKRFKPMQKELSIVICDVQTKEKAVDMLIKIQKITYGLILSIQKIKEKIELELDKYDKEWFTKMLSHLECTSNNNISTALTLSTLYKYEFEESDYIQYANIKESDNVDDMLYEIAERIDEIINLLYKARNKLYFDNNEKQELRMPTDTPIEFGVCKGYRTLENALHVGYGHEMWRSYHSYKNPEALPGCVMTSLVAIFIRSGWVIIVLTWIWYYLFCKSNNKKLAEHPRVQKERKEFIEKQSKKVITQDMVDYCNYYKIPIKYYEDDIK